MISQVSLHQLLSGNKSMENLFSYGTLRQKNVQRETFGRTLEGFKDTLLGYSLKDIEIIDKLVLKASKKKFHPILFFTNNKKDKVDGTVFKITSAELLKADSYEVDDYMRVEVILRSGISSWVYISKND